MIARTCQLYFALLLTAGISYAEEPMSAQETLKGFVNAFADADFKAMGSFYAPKVTVKKGATILDKKYGGLGGDDGRKKDQAVERASLIKAYKKTIEKLGGKDLWIKRHQKLKTIEVMYITDDTKNADKIFSDIGAEKGDVIALVSPKRDALFFHLRKIDGKWRIIAEAWD